MTRTPPISRPRGRQPLAGGVCAAAILIASAGAACAETLADAVAQAYQSNPTLLAQRAQLRALNETYVQARAGFGPRVSADASLNYEEVRNDHNAHVEGRSSTENLSVSQTVFSGGRLTSNLQAVEGDVRAGRERLRQLEADLLLRVIASYVSVRRDQQILAVAEQTTVVLQQQLEETRAKVDVKENTRTDLAQAEAREAAAQSQIYSAQSQLATSRAAYLLNVGQNPGDLAPEPDLPGVPAAIDQAFDQAEADNPTLLAAKYAELASRARLQLARAQNMPNVSLRVEAGRAPNAYYRPNPYLDNFTAQIVASQPLFTAGLNASQIRRASELNTSDRLGIDSTRRSVLQGLSQQWGSLSAARASLRADQINVSSSETAFFGMRQEERLGLRSTIELLNAQQELTSAQIGLLRDRYTEYTSRAAVLSAMGHLRVELLAPDLVSYDPMVDFDAVKNKGWTPVEPVARVIDSVVAPSPGPPLAARETVKPSGQLPLPPAPPPAASAPPMRSISDIMNETRNLGRE